MVSKRKWTRIQNFKHFQSLSLGNKDWFRLNKSTNRLNLILKKKQQQRIVIILVAIGCIAYLIYDLKDPRNLISLIGLFTFILICIFISEHPSRVSFQNEIIKNFINLFREMLYFKNQIR